MTNGELVVDFIVVGAGSSGCAVASRLAQGMPSKKILLVEAGDTDDLPEIHSAVDYFGKSEKIFGSERDWSYHAESQRELNGRALYWPRGRVVGGCSSFNTMVYLRGDPHDYDNWFNMLGPGFETWSYKGMLPFFKRAESHPGDHTVHGKQGPMLVAPLSDSSHFLSATKTGAVHPVTELFIKAANKIGVHTNKDFAKGTEGVNVNDINAFSGKRCSTSAYLRMVGAYPTQLSTTSTDPPGALNVWLCSRADKILFDKTKRATSLKIKLESQFDDTNENAESTSCRWFSGHKIKSKDGNITVHAREEIILCGGAVNSPVLLMQSGVGPADHLNQVNIPVVKDLPGVGSNLKDHLHVPMCYRLEGFQIKPHSHSNVCEGSLFVKLDKSAPSPDLQVHIGTIFFEPDGFSPLGEGFTLTPSLIHPKSVGTIRLQSSDPEDKPIINAKYLSDKDNYDVKQLVEGIKFVRKVGNEMIDLFGNGIEMHPGKSYTTDEELEEYVRKFAGSMYHPACTCRIGKLSDPLAVLDEKLRVRGVYGLRVIDASSMPELPGANTNATCIALGEKGADIIIRDYFRS